MTPFHLHIQLDPESQTLQCQWYGQSALHPEGAQTFPLAPTPLSPLPNSNEFQIDLHPLLTEITADTIEDEEDFQKAEEFLPLKDLLAKNDFEDLCETLYHFLWREARKGLPLEGIQKSADDKVYIDPDQRLVRIWFGTNRKPVKTDGIIQGFDDKESAEQITYGACNVFIPQSHKPGSTGAPWWRRWIRLEADDSLKVHGIYGLSNKIFRNLLSDKMETWWPPNQRNLFVFIHGYNVSFEQAAIRAAQIGYDLKVPGEMAFFSWPSRGATADYMADEATITASAPHIAEFLGELSRQSGAERIHLFVHSMGNRGFLSALERIAARSLPNLRLGQVFFCAPDEDVRTFKDKTTAFPHQSENRTLLVSSKDRAVAASRWLRKQDRVGIVPPLLHYPGIETIQVGGFGLLDMGHGYFASAEPVIKDMREAIETRKPAAERMIPQPVAGHFMIDIRP